MVVPLRQRFLAVARLLLGIVPDSILAKAMPGKLRWDPRAMRVAQAPETEIRLLIAPVNSAGQGYLWARAAERGLVNVGAVSLMTVNAATESFGFPADIKVPASGYVFSHGWQRQQRESIINDFTHLLLESGRFAYGSIPGRTPLQVAEELVALGRPVALLWHGSDIRVPSEHAKSEPDSPFGAGGAYPVEATAVLESNSRRFRRMIDDCDFPVFVSTPGLLDVPRARWLPVVVEPAVWESAEPPLQRDIPVVAYAPSNSPMKGSPSIDAELMTLEQEGVITYRRLQGIPAAEMPAVYRDADIVLDQFRLGDYGVAACEALAAGRIVIGHVNEENRARVRAASGIELPIVQSRLAEVGETIRMILADRLRWSQYAKRGPEFVSAMHDGSASAQVLAEFLGTEIAKPEGNG